MYCSVIEYGANTFSVSMKGPAVPIAENVALRNSSAEAFRVVEAVKHPPGGGTHDVELYRPLVESKKSFSTTVQPAGRTFDVKLLAQLLKPPGRISPCVVT